MQPLIYNSALIYQKFKASHLPVGDNSKPLEKDGEETCLKNLNNLICMCHRLKRVRNHRMSIGTIDGMTFMILDNPPGPGNVPSQIAHRVCTLSESEYESRCRTSCLFASDKLQPAGSIIDP